MKNQISISEFTERYTALIEPVNFFKGWTIPQFKVWCDLGTKADLKATLKVLEQAELFELCAILKKIINDLQTEIR